MLTIKVKSDPLMLDPRGKTSSQMLIYLYLDVYVRNYNICIHVYDLQKSLLFISLCSLTKPDNCSSMLMIIMNGSPMWDFFPSTDNLASFLYVQSVLSIVSNIVFIL